MENNFFILLLLVNLFVLFFNRKRFLFLLINFEFFASLLFFILILYREKSIIVGFLYLSLAAAEAAFGLSLLVSFSRKKSFKNIGGYRGFKF